MGLLGALSVGVILVEGLLVEGVLVNEENMYFMGSKRFIV
jgi:hypothetical protein